MSEPSEQFENPAQNLILDWPSLLEEIRRRPGMFINTKSITLLEAHMKGIWLAESLYEIAEQDRLGGFNFLEFEKWAETNYNPQRLSVLSFGMAYRLSSTDAQAFDLWFSWYDKFRNDTLSN